MAEQRLQGSSLDRRTGLFGDELFRAPALVMALGCWLLYAGPYEAETLGGAGFRDRAVELGRILLVLVSAAIAACLVREWRRDPARLWSCTADHFAIGTWVAAVNILSRVLRDPYVLVATALATIGTVLWLAYLRWVWQALQDRRVVSEVNGTAFLITVSTQSLVLAWVNIWPHPPRVALGLLTLLSVMGLLAYGVSFALVWVRRGPLVQLASWVPPNNITHGALSISSLAALSLAAHLGEVPRLVALGIGLLWVAAATQFAIVLLIELILVISARRPLWRFQVANYARNFTFGMFFACTYQYAQAAWSPLPRLAPSATWLVSLAFLVTILNLWEFGRHLLMALRQLVVRRQILILA